MKVKDLRHMIQYWKDDDSIQIIVSRNQIGPTPTVGIKNMMQGFDWDNHVILIKPEIELVEKGR